MINELTIAELQNKPERTPIADVRSPSEFAHGHIPGAFNLPLFSDEERAKVGTTYKQEGKEAAILLGFELTGPKWAEFIRKALVFAPAKKVAVHCWRGGMRSRAMAWALDLFGFDVWLVEGGYKSYRRWVMQQFNKPYGLWVIGGMTGSGKTKVLHSLRSRGEQVIDLEDLAQHQGSAYGSLNRKLQPSQEQFENNLAEQLHGLDHSRRIWVEDEAPAIGTRFIPLPFWNLMQVADLFELQVPEEKRIPQLVEEYGALDRDFLVACTERIRKRLGNDHTKHAIAAIREGKMDEFIRRVLTYYDKTYYKALSRRSPQHIFSVPAADADPEYNSLQILTMAKSLPALACNKTL